MNTRDINFAHLSSPETHGKNIYKYKGHEPNANMNATHLVHSFKFKRDGTTKVNKLFFVDLQPTHQIHDMDETPSI
jgi:hypothetical protein